MPIKSILPFFILFFLLACEKEDDVTQDDQPLFNVRIAPTKLQVETLEGANIYTYQYSGLGLQHSDLVLYNKFTDVRDTTDRYRYEWKANGALASVFEISNEQERTIQLNYRTDRKLGSMILTIYSLLPNTNPETIRYLYTYHPDGTLRKIVVEYGIDDILPLDSVEVVQDASGNVVELTYPDIRPGKYVFTYDNAANPFKNLIGFDVLPFRAFFFGTSQSRLGYFLHLNRNNVVSIEWQNDGDTTNQFFYEYEYNERLLPVKASNSVGNVATFEY